jgi:hypothetical protein
MIYNKHLYIKRIKEVAEKLDYLLDEVVFVGGAVVALYADDPAAAEVRPTEDIDIVVGISTRPGFSTFEEKLRQLGFKNVIESKFIGRYKVNGIIVDFMPIEENVLGFSNKWYKTGIEQSFLYKIDNDISIRLMPFYYFIASKIEAHNSRNKTDLRTSKDFEDVVYSFDNRLDPLKDMQEARGDVAIYLKGQLDNFMESPNFDEGVYSHLTSASASSRFRRIKGIWSAFTFST